MDQEEIESVKNFVTNTVESGEFLNEIQNPWSISAKSLTILFYKVVRGLGPEQILEILRLNIVRKNQDPITLTSTTDILEISERIAAKASPVDPKDWHPVIILIDTMIDRTVDRTGNQLGLNTSEHDDFQFDHPSSCPRCKPGKGFMIVERDWYGEFSTCLSCGYVHEPIIDAVTEGSESQELN